MTALAKTVFALLLAAHVCLAAPAIFPLKDIRAGQRAVGRTVFKGSRVEEFQVEILGVMENTGPGQSVILAKLSGGPLAETGVMQGMSGSPVYIDGKLVGAVALGFAGAKDAIAGIRPIEEMLRVDPAPKQIAARAGSGKLQELATPLAFSGFSASILEKFGPALRGLGMDPLQGVASGGAIANELGDASKLEPGSMISVQLLTGDMNVSADGTVTAIDGNQLYAFGHRFLATGPTELPFARAEVLALLPNIQNSFKISQAKEWMGVITADRNAAISGVTGRLANMTPLEIKVGATTYKMRMIQDRVMSPLVAQMALASALETDGRAIGSATYALRGRLDFDAGPIDVESTYSGDVGVGSVASLGLASPLALAMSSGFDGLKLRGITLEATPVETRKQVQIADIAATRSVKAGDEVELTVVLSKENGIEDTRKLRYKIPVGMTPGPINFTVSDAASANLADLPSSSTAARSPEQVLAALRRLHTNNKAYVRVWRPGNSFSIEGRELPEPPPSIAAILAKGQPQGAQSSPRGSKVAELEIPIDGVAIGSRTFQVEVRE